MCCHTFFYVQVFEKPFEKMGLAFSIQMIWAKLDERWKLHKGNNFVLNQGQITNVSLSVSVD